MLGAMDIPSPSTSSTNSRDKAEKNVKPFRGVQLELHSLRADIEAGSQNFRVPSKRLRKPVQRFSKELVAAPRHLSRKTGAAKKEVLRQFGVGDKQTFCGLDYCKEIHGKLMGEHHIYSWAFHHPVDVEGLKLTDYLEIIKNPMDLGTIRKKLDNNGYATVFEFAADVRLMFSNCYLYNSPKNHVHKNGKELNKFFEIYLRKIPPIFMTTNGEYFRKAPPPDVIERFLKMGEKRSFFNDFGSENEKMQQRMTLQFLKAQLESVRGKLVELMDCEAGGDMTTMGVLKKARCRPKKTQLESAKTSVPVSLSVSMPVSMPASVSSPVNISSMSVSRCSNSFMSDEEGTEGVEGAEGIEGIEGVEGVEVVEVVEVIEVIKTRDEVRQMSLDVASLPHRDVFAVCCIVQKYEPLTLKAEAGSDEIVLDFDKLGEKTLRAIDAFLKDYRRRTELN